MEPPARPPAPVKIAQVLSRVSSQQLPRVLTASLETPSASPRRDQTTAVDDELWGRVPNRGLFGPSGGRTIECPNDLKTMCRLIGLHSRDTLDVGGTVVFNMGGEDSLECSFKILSCVETTYNLKCLIFEEEMMQYKNRTLHDLNRYPSSASSEAFRRELISMDDDGKHLIFAFNWFSPKGVWDYVSLGYQLLTDTSIDTKYSMLGSVYVEKAEDFMWDPQVIKLFDTYSITSSAQDTGVMKLITMTGFSLGGAIAHAFAYLLRETKKVKLPLRVIGIGCPRPGTPELTLWFHRELLADSCSVFLYDEVIQEDDTKSKRVLMEYDPAVMGPSLAAGYDYHPNGFILHKRFGTLRPLTDQEKDYLATNVTESSQPSLLKAVMGGLSRDRNRLWAKYHGILKYYEGMYGLG